MLRDTAGEGRLQPNPFPLLRFFNPSVLRTPPLYFAMQNTEEEVNTFLYIMFVLLPYRVPQHCGVSHSGIGGVPVGRRKPPTTVTEL